MQWDFWEKDHWIPRAVMWDKDWNLPQGKVWGDLVTKTWWTNADSNLDKQGVYKTRTYKFALSPQNNNLTVAFR